jgi:hypothetical protein
MNGAFFPAIRGSITDRSYSTSYILVRYLLDDAMQDGKCLL